MFFCFLNRFSVGTRGIRASAADPMPDPRGKEFPVLASFLEGPGPDRWAGTFTDIEASRPKRSGEHFAPTAPAPVPAVAW